MTIIAVILTIASNYGAGMIAGRLAGMSPKASLNVGFTWSPGANSPLSWRTSARPEG